MSETALKAKVLKAIKKEYPTAWVYKASDKFTAGILDLIICLEGRFVSIELKYGDNVPTPLQKNTVKKVRLARGKADVCWSKKEVMDLLYLWHKEFCSQDKIIKAYVNSNRTIQIENINLREMTSINE